MPPNAPTDLTSPASPPAVAEHLARAIDAKDSWTRRHCRAVSELCGRIALVLGLDRRARERLALAAELHDVGKLLIPDAILQKPGRLDADEQQVMRRHPDLGARIVRAAGLNGIARVVRHHHERVDGCGYPSGLCGEQIPLESRVILVADAFEAMTAERPYARARRPADAMRELERHAGTQFDAPCVTALITSMEAIGNAHVHGGKLGRAAPAPASAGRSGP